MKPPLKRVRDTIPTESEVDALSQTQLPLEDNVEKPSTQTQILDKSQTDVPVKPRLVRVRDQLMPEESKRVDPDLEEMLGSPTPPCQNYEPKLKQAQDFSSTPPVDTQPVPGRFNQSQ